jgi:hypothetical protein
MKYVFKSIFDLSEDEIYQYISLFNRIFDRDMNAEEFREKFTRRLGSQTFFVLLINEAREVVGSVGAIEVPYTYRGRTYKLALTVDGMIDPEHRTDWLALKRQHDLLTAELAQRGFVYMFTKPNGKSYLYLKKFAGYRDLGELAVYHLPLHPFRLLAPQARWIDRGWRLLLAATAQAVSSGHEFREIIIEAVTPVLSGASETDLYRRRDAAFLHNRYAASRYCCVSCGDGFIVYTVQAYDGRIVCFVMEAERLRPRDWFAFVRYLLDRHAEAELIMRVVGQRRQHQPLLRIPRSLLPDKLHVIGRPIGAAVFPPDIQLRVDLSDFEVI